MNEMEEIRREISNLNQKKATLQTYSDNLQTQKIEDRELIQEELKGILGRNFAYEAIQIDEVNDNLRQMTQEQHLLKENIIENQEKFIEKIDTLNQFYKNTGSLEKLYKEKENLLNQSFQKRRDLLNSQIQEEEKYLENLQRKKKNILIILAIIFLLSFLIGFFLGITILQKTGIQLPWIKI